MTFKLSREGVERVVEEAREKGKRPNLNGVDLRLMDFRGANLSETNLVETDLRGANLSETNLSGVDLREANLRETNLSKANLSEANLSGVNLRGANLSEANLSEADLSWAYLRETIISDLDLRQVKGLKQINHNGPSTIGTNTLVKSQGQIPIEFLRGCGLSDLEIEIVKLHNPNLYADEFTLITYELHRLRFGDAIKFNSCFISYSSQDDPFARKLYDDLQNSGVRCWFAPEDMKIGDKILHSIDESIRLQDKLLIILSEDSIKSQWVEGEVTNALHLEVERGEPVLFPIRLDNAVMDVKTGWVARIKQDRHIGDFCNWQDDEAYQVGFAKLLEDLQV